MQTLSNNELWAQWLAQLQLWLETGLFVQATVIEIIAIAACAAVAWPLSRKLRAAGIPSAGKYFGHPILGRLFNTMYNLSFPLLWMIFQWILILISNEIEVRNSVQVVITSLLGAWVIVRFATIPVSNSFWATLIAVTAWSVAALNILGILDEAVAVLDNAAITLGQVTFSVLTITQGLIALGILLWVATVGGQLIENRLKSAPNLSPSVKVLSVKLIRIGLAVLAVTTALAIVGVDLTALAVFGGAIGVGLGFGMQRIFANLISGFMLLLDRSIKPGDVIALPGYFGRVDSLGARYTSVTTRDGTEHLIPNEELITTRVENWSHTDNLVRLRQAVGVHYKSDIHEVIRICVEAALETPRILSEPKPTCLLREFGDSSVNFEVRFWIQDPMNGRGNVTSDLLVRIWDKFKEHGIEIPYPQRDLHLRSSEIGKFPD
ncbi:MAG: mechanosensitive ion channel [Gammaproteobacteria bacterium]